MIDYGNEICKFNNNYSNTCPQNLNLIKWIVSCLQIEKNSIYRKNQKNSNNFLDSSKIQFNTCFFNADDFFSKNFNINSGLYYTIPIHYLTRGKIFSPKKAKNYFENNLTQFILNQQMYLNYINECNKKIECDQRSLSIDEGHHPEAPLDTHVGMCGQADFACLSESCCGSLQCSSESWYAVPRPDFYYRDRSTTAYTPVSYTPDRKFSQSSKASDTPSSHPKVNLTPVGIEPKTYTPIPNDLLDVAFANWYNSNKIESRWSRMRKGVYKVKGKQINLSMVKGELFIKILDEFSRKQYNMPIGEYARRR